jgi:hypothetical protein
MRDCGWRKYSDQILDNLCTAFIAPAETSLMAFDVSCSVTVSKYDGRKVSSEIPSGALMIYTPTLLASTYKAFCDGFQKGHSPAVVEPAPPGPGPSDRTCTVLRHR